MSQKEIAEREIAPVKHPARQNGEQWWPITDKQITYVYIMYIEKYSDSLVDNNKNEKRTISKKPNLTVTNQEH